MKATTREKLLRIILSSILSSDLTKNEIKTMSNSLTTNDNIFYDLQNMLRDIITNFDRNSSDKLPPQDTFLDENDRLLEAMNIIKRKRISKTS